MGQGLLEFVFNVIYQLLSLLINLVLSFKEAPAFVVSGCFQGMQLFWIYHLFLPKSMLCVFSSAFSMSSICTMAIIQRADLHQEVPVVAICADMAKLIYLPVVLRTLAGYSRYSKGIPSSRHILYSPRRRKQEP